MLPFSEAFAPLAHHFFPDGCPLISSPNSREEEDDEESNYLQEAWPSNSARRRETVSAEKALQSISHIRDYAVCHGLTPAEIVAVTFVATATLPTRDRPNAVYSPIRDGSATHFVALVRCLLPKYVVGSEIDTKHQQHQEAALRIVIARLLATGCQFRGVQDNDAAHFDVRRGVLQFLLLASEYCYCLEQSSMFLQWVSVPLPIVYQWALHPSTSMDSLRVLWHLAPPIPVFRLKQLQRFYHKMNQEKSSTAVSPAVSALLARYDVPIRQMASTMKDGERDDWKCFPDANWEVEFSGEIRGRHHGELKGSTVKQSGESPIADHLSRRAQNHAAGEEEPSKPSKRQRLLTRRDLSSFFCYIESFVSAKSSTSDKSRHRKIGMETLCIATASVADMLRDSFLQHLFALGAGDENMEGERPRFQEILPYKLHEGWFESGDSESSRRDVLSSLADWAVRCGTIPMEAQSFLLQNVPAVWDGDIDSKMGEMFLYRVLPRIPSEAHNIGAASRENIFNDLSIRIIDTLGQSIVHGSKRVWYAAISGTFSTLIFRWYLLNFSESKTVEHTGDAEVLTQPSVTGFQEVVERVDEYILKGFLVAEETDVFLCSAATDFFDSVCDIQARIGPVRFAEVVAPSSPLVYRLLLSPSGLNIDRACGLLMRYRGIFHAWKDQQNTDPKYDSTSGRSEKSLGISRIKEYNCFLWDFCSVLWHSSRPLPPSRSDESASNSSILFTELRQSTQETLLKAKSSRSFLSITHGAAFVQYALDFLETKNQGEMIHCDQTLSYSSDRIQGETQVRYIDYLTKEHEFYNLYSFLSTYVSILASPKDET